MANPFRRLKSDTAAPRQSVNDGRIDAPTESALIRDVPHFNLAPLTRIDRRVFYGGDDADGFVLSLARIYNDFKQIEWTQQLVLGAARLVVAPESGQVLGMGIWASRFTFSLLYELFNAIRLAERHGVFDSTAFVRCVGPAAIHERWTALLRIAKGEDVDHAEASALKAYEAMRNRGTYHYGDSGRLLQGYWKFFHELPPSDFNAHAYMSFGDSLEETRFYFADAAVASLYDTGDEAGTELRDTTAEMRRLVSETLALVVERYVRIRQADANLPAEPVSGAEKPRSRRRSKAPGAE